MAKDKIHDAVKHALVKDGHRTMDKLSQYRQLIMRLLAEFAERANRASVPVSERLTVFDTNSDQFLVVHAGWANGRRMRGTPLYLRLSEGKIWIEDDLTEGGVTKDLLAAGVPQQDIVLVFQSPERRALTEFAVA